MANDAHVGVERLLFLRTLATPTHGPEAVHIAAAMRDVHFAEGQQLFALGEPSGQIYFVVKGSVQMTAPDAAPWDFEAPAVVGAMDSFAGRARTRRAVARSATHALALAHTDWLRVLEDHPSFARHSVVRLSSALGRMRLGIPGDGGHPRAAPDERPLAKGLGLFDKAVALRGAALFQTVGMEATLRLAEAARELSLEAGAALFREGEACETLDVVIAGTVEATRASPALAAAFGPGAIVGGAASVGLSLQPFDATAGRAAVVLRLEKEDVFDVMEDHFDLTRAVLSFINGEREALMREHGVIEERGPGASGGGSAR